jgi:hypothetical protein
MFPNLTIRKWKTTWSVIPLIGGIIGFSVLTISFAKYAYGGLHRCFWAYWLTLGNLGSSALLEIVEYKFNHA